MCVHKFISSYISATKYLHGSTLIVLMQHIILQNTASENLMKNVSRSCKKYVESLQLLRKSERILIFLPITSELYIEGVTQEKGIH